MKKIIQGCGLAAVLGFAGCVGLVLIGSNLEDTPTTTTSPTEAPADVAAPSNGETIAKGEYGEVQGRAIAVTGIRAAEGIALDNQFLDPVPGPIFWVDAKFKNTSNESGNFQFSQMELIDSQGRKYSEVTDLTYMTYRSETGLPNRADDYFPGEEKIEAIAFRVAPDALPTHIEWKGLKLQVE
ncbi:MAG: hypothetical protein ACFB14_20745 [Leptolyngbyaceae cyanobacterium]